MQEYQTYKPMVTECVREIGYIDKGTGKHQSNTVYSPIGVCPTIPAVSYKEPLKIGDI
jgi:hypothetical protein